MDKNKYYFDEPLIEGLIINRPNRFLMNVSIDNKQFLCHCPATGRIANIVFENIPCLLSKKNDCDIKRKTCYTVEAISLNNQNDDLKHWIGINQNRSNRYIEFLFKTNQLKNIVNYKGSLLREQKLGNSKLDFLVENNYIEVKTPLIFLPLKDFYLTNKNIKYIKDVKFNSADRFLKHVNELKESLKTHEKAFLITLFTFEAMEFKPPRRDIDREIGTKIRKKIKNSIEKGVNLWQVNLIIDKYGVKLSNYFDITNKII